MFRKTLIALAATATLGVAALAPTSASAWYGGGYGYRSYGGGYHHHHHYNGGYGYRGYGGGYRSYRSYGGGYGHSYGYRGYGRRW
jgi:hypothetical protein